MNEYTPEVISLHLRKLKEVVKEYSDLDYKIFANLKGYERPRKIGNYEPDLIVKKGEREIIIEILSKSQMKDLEPKLEQLAKYADETKDTRFDLVLTNPRPRTPKNEMTVSGVEMLKQIRRSLILNADAAYRRHHNTAAYYLVYVLLKNLLQEYAIKNGISLDESKRTLSNIGSNLRLQGLLDVDDYRVIRDIVQVKKKMISKPATYRVDEILLVEATELVKRFISDLN